MANYSSLRAMRTKMCRKRFRSLLVKYCKESRERVYSLYISKHTALPCLSVHFQTHGLAFVQMSVSVEMTFHGDEFGKANECMIEEFLAFAP